MSKTKLQKLQRKTIVRNAIAFSIALILCLPLCAPAYGQQSFGTGQTVRPNVIQKMDEIRDKLKQTFGPIAPDRVRQTNSRENSQVHQANPIPPSRPSNVEQAAFQFPAQPFQPGGIPTGYGPPNTNANLAGAYQTDSGSRPASQPDYQQSGYQHFSNSPVQQPPYAGTQQGHFRNGSAVDSGIAQQSQITATQRALRLQEENESLQISNQAMIEENERLRAMLNDRETEIENYHSELGIVRAELSDALQTSSQLKRRIADLLDERAIREQETARMLDSIRSQLDDVLMKKMVDK